MKRILTILSYCILASSMSAQATFESQNSGSWSSAATWSIVSGIDSNSDNIPDANDVVTVKTTHTVNLTGTSYCAGLLIENNARLTGNGQNFGLRGNLNIQGQIAGTINLFFQANCTFSSASPYVNPGNLWMQAGILTIAPGTTINKSGNTLEFQNSTVRTVNNYGTVILANIGFNNNNCFWNNMPNSSLQLYGSYGVSPSLGVLNASATPNQVSYVRSSPLTVKPVTYYNLTLSGTSTKSINANLNVLNNLHIASGNVLNANNFNITVGGNWTNSANTTVLNQATVTLNPSGTGTITKASSETFNNLVINGSGTTILGTNINVTNNLTVNSGSLDVSASNYTINVGGDLTINSSFNTRSGLVNLNGSALQTISGSSALLFYDLSLNNGSGAVVNSPATVTDALTVTNGNFNSNGNVTLESDASNTARLGEVGAGGSFSGTMIIRKHISGRVKNWHDLSSPVQATTIFDWDDEMYMSGFSTVDSPAGIAGVDGIAGGFISVRTYNEPTATFANVTNSTTILAPGTGYYIWLSDDMNNWNAKTFDSRGVPNFGTQNKSLSFTASAGAYAGLNLVGNPFASAIDYSLVNKVNTDGHAYGYDNGVWTDYGTNAILTAHQGFWAYALSSGASLSFPESAKSSVTATSFHRATPNYCIKLIYTNSDVQFFNEAKVNIQEGTSEKWDVGADAIFMSNPDADASTISFNTGQMKLLTNTVSDKQDEIILPLELFSPKAGLYNIQPSVINIGEFKYSWIENVKTGEKFMLDNSISISVENAGENNDYVLKLSKKAPHSDIVQNLLKNDLMIFNYDQTLTLKSNQLAHHITQLNIIDMTGKVVLSHSDLRLDQNSLLQIDLSGLNNGMYIVNATDVMGNTTLRKIAK